MTTVAKNSFLLFLYPFRFESSGYAELLAAVDGLHGPTRSSEAKLWIKHQFAEDDLLPHVARYLNPAEGVSPTARLWHMDNNLLRSTAFLGAGAEWKLSAPHGEIPFVLDGLQLALFRAGTGFLTLRVHLQTDALADWQNFIHYFRFQRRPHDVTLKVRRRTGIDPETRAPIYEGYRPAIIPTTGNGGNNDPGLSSGESPFPDLVMSEIVNALLRMAGSNNADQDWWRDVFIPGQLIPFVSLFVNELPEGAAPGLLYKMRNFFHHLQGENPAPEDLRADNDSLLPYVERQWFTFSLDGGAFVGVDVPDTQFFLQTLSDHLRDQYFLLFLLVQHQRFVLMDLSQQVSQYWLHGDEAVRAQAFERIRDALLDFTARGYFAQVMQREHHHRYYRRLQEALDISRLYLEVRDEVTEMQDYLQMKRTARLQSLAEAHREQLEKTAAEEAHRDRRLEKRISLIGMLVGAPALLIGFLSINLVGVTSGPEGLPVWKALVIIGGLSALAIGLVALIVRVLEKKPGAGSG